MLLSGPFIPARKKVIQILVMSKSVCDKADQGLSLHPPVVSISVLCFGRHSGHFVGLTSLPAMDHRSSTGDIINLNLCECGSFIAHDSPPNYFSPTLHLDL